MNDSDKNFLKERALVFFENAIDLMNKEKLEIAAFNFEQSAQLYIKHYLFSKLKDFPRIHSIEELLKEVSKLHESEEKINKFIKDNIWVISDLEEAYLTSRYLPVKFPKEKVEGMKSFVEKLAKTLFQNEDNN